MAIQTIIVIRHAEKPGPFGSIGISETGAENPNELSVRGWQRAGAMTQYFTSPAKKTFATKPDWMFAAAPSEDYVSVRSISTLTPLSRLLGVPVSKHFTPGDEKALGHHVESLEGVILIAWEHKKIPELARHLLGTGTEVPDPWPEERFDLVWLFVRDGTKPRRFKQLPQRLLDHDTDTVA